MEELYLKLSVEDRAKFWNEFDRAMKWRGWDRVKTSIGGKAFHAMQFIDLVENLSEKYGVEFEEYT